MPPSDPARPCADSGMDRSRTGDLTSSSMPLASIGLQLSRQGKQHAHSELADLCVHGIALIPDQYVVNIAIP